MNTVIVHEFEKINEEILNNKMKENNIYGYNNAFSELIEFIEEFNETEDNVDSYEFLKVRKDRQYGLHICFRNYVGLIQLKSGFQIEVLPKIDMSCSNSETKRIVLKMLRSMKGFNGKAFNISNLGVDNMNIYEIFINMYLHDVSWLVKSGLKSSYIMNEDNLTVFKGKINFNENIKRNLSHKERAYIFYDEYSLDRSENKIIKSTLLKLLSISDNQNNKKICRQLLMHFENVNPSINYDADFQKVHIDRSNKEYEHIMTWSKVFLKNKSFTSFSGESVSRAILFPMEKLFESYVAKYTKKVFYDYEVSSQDRGYYLFDLPTKQFSLRPDLVVTNNMGDVVIMDTKWKNLYNSGKNNFGISQGDMYQMYAYSKKYNTSNIWLLYPLNEEMRNHDLITFSSQDNVTVKIFFVNVANIENSLQELKGLIEENA